MRYETTTPSKADPARLWAALTDVEHWPDVIGTYARVKRLDDGPLRIGSRAEVKQYGLVAAVWEVTEMQDGRSFVWVARTTGSRTTGWHEVIARPDGITELRLGIELTGWATGFAGLLLGRKVRRYVDAEASALIAKAESADR